MNLLEQYGSKCNLFNDGERSDLCLYCPSILASKCYEWDASDTSQTNEEEESNEQIY